MAIVRHNRKFTKAQLEAAVGSATIAETTAVVDGTIYYANDADGVYYGFDDSGTAKLRRSATVPGDITIDGVKASTTDHRDYTINAFGVCSTAADEKAKVVSITSGTPSLTAGCRIVVKFDYANTATTELQSNVTLNVNSLGAKNIIVNGNTLLTSDYTRLRNICEFIYDGTQ